MKRALLVLLLVSMTGCSVVSTQVNEIGLEYSGGFTEDKAFVRLVPPGATANGKGWGNEVYLYPNDQRNYRFSSDGLADIAAAIVVPSREGTRVIIEGIISFKLCIAPVNDPTAVEDDWGDNAYANCLRTFHENIGLKTQAFTFEGWRAMLQEFLRPAINVSVTRSSRSFTIDELLATEALDRFNTQIADTLPAELASKMNGNFFYISDVSFEEIAPEAVTVQSEYDERAAARLDVATERERGDLRSVQEENLQRLRSIFSDEGQLNCYLQIELGRELGQMPPPCFAEEPQAVVETGQP